MITIPLVIQKTQFKDCWLHFVEFLDPIWLDLPKISLLKSGQKGHGEATNKLGADFPIFAPICVTSSKPESPLLINQDNTVTECAYSTLLKYKENNIIWKKQNIKNSKAVQIILLIW